MRFLTDENLNNHIYRSLLLQRPNLDILRVQYVGLSGKPDHDILNWAISENRILLTHDVRTIPAIAFNWLINNQEIPGILLIEQTSPVGPIISNLLLILDVTEQQE